MTTATATRSAYPRTVAELIPHARQLAEQLGETPGRNLLMKTFHIGDRKANALLAELAPAPAVPMADDAAPTGAPPMPTAPEPVEQPSTAAGLVVEPEVTAPVPSIDPTDEVAWVGISRAPAAPPAAPASPAVPAVPMVTSPGGDTKRLKRIGWAVRAVFALGIAASLAGNVLHANDNIISQAIAAWSPLALLLAVELIARIPVRRGWLSAVRLGVTAVIAGIAAWVSYWHMVGVAIEYGETGASAYLIPFSVDGLIVVASISLVEIGGRVRALVARDLS